MCLQELSENMVSFGEKSWHGSGRMRFWLWGFFGGLRRKPERDGFRNREAERLNCYSFTPSQSKYA